MTLAEGEALSLSGTDPVLSPRERDLHQILDSGYWLVTGCWLLVAGSWLLSSHSLKVTLSIPRHSVLPEPGILYLEPINKINVFLH